MLMPPNLIPWQVSSLVETNKEKEGRKFWFNIIMQMLPKYAEYGLKCQDDTKRTKGER